MQNTEITTIANEMPAAIVVHLRQPLAGVLLNGVGRALDQGRCSRELEVPSVDVSIPIVESTNQVAFQVGRNDGKGRGIRLVGANTKGSQLVNEVNAWNHELGHCVGLIACRDEVHSDRMSAPHCITNCHENGGVGLFEFDAKESTGGAVGDKAIRDHKTQDVGFLWGIDGLKKGAIYGVLGVPKVRRTLDRQAVAFAPGANRLDAGAKVFGQLPIRHLFLQRAKNLGILVRHGKPRNGPISDVIISEVQFKRQADLGRKSKRRREQEISRPTRILVVTKVYDAVLLRRAIPNLLHAQFGQHRPIPKNSGKSIEFRRYNSLPAATTPLTEGTVPTGSNMSVSNVTASINQYGAYVQFSDLLALTTFDAYLVETADVLGEQAGDSIDQVIRNVLTAGSNVRFAGGVGSRGALTASSVVNSSEMRRLNRSLKRANARPFPELNNRYAFVAHPDITFDLLGDSVVTTAFQRGAPRGWDDQPELLGYIGEYSGFALFESTNARIYASSGATGADVYASLAIGQDAYGVTEIDTDGLQTYYQPLGSGGATGDPLGQIGSIGWKVNFTAELLNQSWLVRLESGATP